MTRTMNRTSSRRRGRLLATLVATSLSFGGAVAVASHAAAAVLPLWTPAPGYTGPTPAWPPTPTPTTPGTSPGPSTTPTRDYPTPAGACQATMRVASSWPGGYLAEVTVSASKVMTGWSTNFNLPTGSTVNAVWGGTLRGTYVVENLPWAVPVPSQTPVTYGMVVSGPVPATLPRVTCTA